VCVLCVRIVVWYLMDQHLKMKKKLQALCTMTSRLERATCETRHQRERSKIMCRAVHCANHGFTHTQKKRGCCNTNSSSFFVMDCSYCTESSLFFFEDGWLHVRRYGTFFPLNPERGTGRTGQVVVATNEPPPGTASSSTRYLFFVNKKRKLFDFYFDSTVLCVKQTVQVSVSVEPQVGGGSAN
jgi:hypothetical protein